MAVGNSNKVVIELPVGMKEQIYKEIKARGLNLRQWFIDKAREELLVSSKSLKSTKKES